jgi:hypothetical protein
VFLFSQGSSFVALSGSAISALSAVKFSNSVMRNPRPAGLVCMRPARVQTHILCSPIGRKAKKFSDLMDVVGMAKFSEQCLNSAVRSSAILRGVEW